MGIGVLSQSNFSFGLSWAYGQTLDTMGYEILSSRPRPLRLFGADFSNWILSSPFFKIDKQGLTVVVNIRIIPDDISRSKFVGRCIKFPGDPFSKRRS